jgi:hypothetical protein
MKEREIQASVVGFARGRGILARKLNFGEGWPDFMFLWNGRILFIEFKQRKVKPKPLQLHVGQLLRDIGFQVEVVNDMAKGMRLIEDWRSL